MGALVIERLYFKEYLSFKETELFFKPSLIVFTGPSGAGKSVLIGALLALFGLKTCEARVSEVDFTSPVDLEAYGYENEEPATIKALKKEKVRYFLNSQSISKKRLAAIFSSYVTYLHQRDNSFFEHENFLRLLENSIDSKEYENLKESFEASYKVYSELKRELERLEEMERKNEQMREFLEFEIQKIASVDPKPGEYEELMEIKRALSKREKIAEALQRAQAIFEYEGAVEEALELMEAKSEFFKEAMERLRDLFFAQNERFEELESVNIEEVLERLEALSALKRRYGSVEEAIEALKEKRRELERLENISFEKRELQRKIEEAEQKVLRLAKELSRMRKEAAKSLEAEVNAMLPSLKLPPVSIEHRQKELTHEGMDTFRVHLQGVPFEKISSGEYNRLRLSFLAASKSGGGVLVLDEIDANISGEESMAVAKILKKLAKNYQIFAISHQAQLASLADQHFLVTKEGGESRVKELGGEERVAEIARIISGENITQEAINFAKKMLKEAV
jgi:DNA repair protein RecN (Recombination protein N)